MLHADIRQVHSIPASGPQADEEFYVLDRSDSLRAHAKVSYVTADRADVVGSKSHAQEADPMSSIGFDFAISVVYDRYC